MVDLSGPAIRLFLFGLFAGLTAILAGVIGPTYDNLLVPEMATPSLFPPFPPAPGDPSFLAGAVGFSGFLVADLVDPAIGLAALAVAVVLLARSFFGAWKGAPEPVLARLVVAVLLANFTLPTASAVLGVAGATYPLIASWDGGAWEHWVNLAGYGEVAYSWDNGALAFVLTFALFALVLALAAAVALRDALLAVLVVLLPVVTLLWPVPTLAPIARRAWLWFAELAFLPCVVVVPLELAVGAPNVLLLLGFLTVAVGAPAFLSMAGAQLSSVGFGSAGAAVGGALQRGLGAASRSVSGVLAPLGRSAGLAPVARDAAGVTARTLGSTAFPAAIPVLAAEFLGRGTAHLLRHVAGANAGGDRFPAAAGSAAAGRARGR